MRLISINCPNCSAALDVDEQTRAVRCSYCRTTFVREQGSGDAGGQTDASERVASELALRRLFHDRRRLEKELKLPETLSAVAAHLSETSREVRLFTRTMEHNQRSTN